MAPRPARGAIALGVLSGGLGAGFGAALAPARRLDLGAVELGFIAGAYPAMALREERSSAIALDFAASAIFVGLAALSLRRRSRLLVSAGLLAHAAWDVAHQLGTPGTEPPEWFPAFCCAADIALAIQFVRGG